ncbi:MAG: prolipoprotein diacylglyceryl transferase [Candidatus Babeliales bacterium]
MGYELFNIYGPIGIHTYGLFIALGLMIFSWLVMQDKRFTTLKLTNKFSDILFVGIIAALFGGRFLYILEEPSAFENYIEWFAFWKEGFSLLGSILGIIVIMPWYLKKLHIPVIPFADLISIYAPLLQSIARLGCFFAGCCYGLPTTLYWATIYTDANTVAPLYCYLHPTQLYSAGLLFLIFIFMYFIFQKIANKSGQLVTIYLMLASTERFIVDFWRADRTIMVNFSPLSFMQWVAFFIFIGAFSGFLYASHQQEQY